MTNFTYSETDLAPAVVDSFVKIVAILGGFAGLVALVIIWNFVRGRPVLGRKL